MIRKSNFSENFEKFHERRGILKQPVWTFLLEQIFVTLSRKDINELLQEILKNHGLHHIFCRSISWLEEYLFIPQNLLMNSLSPSEIERYNVIYYLHEYVSATWPEYKLKLPLLIEKLLKSIREAPAPRIDTSLYVAIAESLSGKQYMSPTTHMLEKFREPWLIKNIERFGYVDEGYLCDTFRWHRHDSISETPNFSEGYRRSDVALSANLLNSTAHQFHGAVLHRAVCNEDKEKDVEVVQKLLENKKDTNINFLNHAGQSILQVATILSPSIKAINLILGIDEVDVNKADMEKRLCLRP